MLKQVVLIFILFVLLEHCSSLKGFHNEEKVGGFPGLLVFKKIQNLSKHCGRYTCYNGGICLDVTNGFLCHCKDPFFGERCELDICQYDPCENGGTCELVGNLYRCHCPFPYFGEFCQKDPCSPNPCENGGKCEIIDGSFSCTCKNPYHGAICELDPCSPNPCDNGGKCKIIGYSFNCTCRNPYFGEACALGPCAPNPCLNGGECEEDGENFKCTCESPFTGSICEQKFCETDSECLHGGVCRQISRNKNACVCAPNYGGSRCEVKLLCVNLDRSCRMMNAVCLVVDNHAVCACPNGTVYQRNSGLCEDICDHRECLHGKCERTGKTFKCNCDEGYTGNHCDKKEKELHVTENIIVWFTMTAFINLFMCLLLIGVFCAVCRIQRLFKSV